MKGSVENINIFAMVLKTGQKKKPWSFEHVGLGFVNTVFIYVVLPLHYHYTPHFFFLLQHPSTVEKLTTDLLYLLESKLSVSSSVQQRETNNFI